MDLRLQPVFTCNVSAKVFQSAIEALLRLFGIGTSGDKLPSGLGGVRFNGYGIAGPLAGSEPYRQVAHDGVEDFWGVDEEGGASALLRRDEEPQYADEGGRDANKGGPSWRTANSGEDEAGEESGGETEREYYRGTQAFRRIRERGGCNVRAVWLVGVRRDKRSGYGSYYGLGL